MSTMLLGLYHDTLIDLDNLVSPTKNHFCMQKLPGTNVPKVLKPLYKCRRADSKVVGGLDDACLAAPKVQQTKHLGHWKMTSVEKGISGHRLFLLAPSTTKQEARHGTFLFHLGVIPVTVVTIDAVT